MKAALKKRIPYAATAPSSSQGDAILDQFLEYTQERGVELYPAQEEAVLEIIAGKNVILNTPTGSGKSLVALALHYDSLVKGRRSFYTSPIKALVNEKFFDLCREFGAENVGIVTGDAAVNADAPIICCTAEILAIDALREGSLAKVDDVVMDEFHYYSDPDRGVAWQIPLLCLPQTRFLLMSATLGDAAPFEKMLTDLNGLPTVLVKSTERPVPLDFSYSEVPLHECVADLIQKGRAPIYLVSFTQRECAEEARNFMSIDICTKEEKKAIAEALVGFKFSSPYGRELKTFLRHGMGLHHAGLLPKYRILIERLSQKGLLKIIFGTDTLGVGVNVPLRTVLFTKLCKFNGTKATILNVRDFQQIAGRAGRKGFDNLGTVVAQAPEHLIENLRNEQKAAGDPKKLKKLVKKKPPERGFVPWSQDTFWRLVKSESEPLTSKFRVSHAMLLNVLSRPHEDGCRAMQKLIRKCHETPIQKKKIFKQAFELFRSLVDRQIIEFNPLRVNVELQEDFSLNHALSLFLVDTLRLLDKSSPTYALEVLTLAESILESPDLILRKQVDQLKTEKMQELKAMGMEYEERLEELDKVEHPKPMRDFIYDTFNEFARKHPWLGEENIRPKSIAREMYEGFFSFGEYIKEYDLQRAEGLLLRYLSDVYKALTQNVPEFAKDEEVHNISVYFGTMIRQIDSSLIDDWERLKNPTIVAAGVSVEAPEVEDTEWNRKSFIVMLRNEAFRFVRCLAKQDYESALELLEIDNDAETVNPGLFDTPEKLERIMKNYYNEGHGDLLMDSRARGTEHVRITPDHPQLGKSHRWIVEQVLVDSNEHNDWVARFEVDVAKSKLERRPILQLVFLGSASEA